MTTIETESPLSVSKYLRHVLGNHNTLPTRKSVHTREPWYRVERGEIAPILIAPMSRSDFRVLLNETDARHLNNYYGIYPDSTIGQAGRKALLAYLNSTFVDEIVAQHQRTYSGGLSKVEPGDVNDIPVINPTELPSEVITTLAEYFDDLRDAARGDEDEATIIRRIDTVLRREL